MMTLVATLVPFCFKLLLALSFWGSTDIPNFQYSADLVAAGRPFAMNYTPAFYPLVLVARTLADTSGLPFSFFFKGINITAELLLALLLLEALRVRGMAYPRALAWSVLYQLNPVNLGVTVFQGQMDSLAILLIVLAVRCHHTQFERRDGFLTGVLLAMAVGIKVFPLFVLPLFLIPLGGNPLRWPRRAWLCLGFAAGMAVLAAPYLLGGLSCALEIFRAPLRYVPRPLVGNYLLLITLLPRDALVWLLVHLHWILVGSCLAVCWISLRRSLSLERAILGVFLAVLTVSCTVAPQYLVWPVFFLASTGMRRTSLLYSYVLGILLIFFYLCDVENSGTYVAADFATRWQPTFNWSEANSWIRAGMQTLRWHGAWLTVLVSLGAWLLSAGRRQNQDGGTPQCGNWLRVGTAGIALVILGGSTLVSLHLMLAFPTCDSARPLPSVTSMSTLQWQSRVYYGRNRLYNVAVNLPGAVPWRYLKLSGAGSDYFSLGLSDRACAFEEVGANFESNHGGYSVYHGRTFCYPLTAKQRAAGVARFLFLDRLVGLGRPFNAAPFSVSLLTDSSELSAPDVRSAVEEGSHSLATRFLGIVQGSEPWPPAPLTPRMPSVAPNVAQTAGHVSILSVLLALHTAWLLAGWRLL